MRCVSMCVCQDVRECVCMCEYDSQFDLQSYIYDE